MRHRQGGCQRQGVSRQGGGEVSKLGRKQKKNLIQRDQITGMQKKTPLHIIKNNCSFSSIAKKN